MLETQAQKLIRHQMIGYSGAILVRVPTAPESLLQSRKQTNKQTKKPKQNKLKHVEKKQEEKIQKQKTT